MNGSGVFFSQIMQKSFGTCEQTNSHTFQELGMDPPQAQVFHRPTANSGHWERAYALEASVPVTRIIPLRTKGTTHRASLNA